MEDMEDIKKILEKMDNDKLSELCEVLDQISVVSDRLSTNIARYKILELRKKILNQNYDCE